jgi:hypothetical protein
VDEVNSTNCFNSSDIGFDNVYTESINASPTLNPSHTLAMAMILALLCILT